MNKVLFERVCTLEAKLDLEIQKRWQAEQRIVDLEKEIHKLQYFLSLKQDNNETTVG